MVDSEIEISVLEQIEESIVARLKSESTRLNFSSEQIIVATADAIKTEGVLSGGGIMLHYSGSNTDNPLVNGQRLARRLVFTVSVGRKMSNKNKRLTGDVERIVNVITREAFIDNKFKLVWLKDAFLMVYNGIGIHDIQFTCLIPA